MSAKAENSETVRRGRRRRGGRRRRFVAPRPDTTLSHLVKTFVGESLVNFLFWPFLGRFMYCYSIAKKVTRLRRLSGPRKTYPTTAKDRQLSC
jgi:hypothetical protein